MVDLGSFHFETEMVLSIESEGSNIELPIILYGDYKAPNLFTAVMSINLVFITVETEIVNTGDRTYVKDPLTGLWQVETSTETGFLNPADLINLKLSDFRNLVFTGTESLDGIESYVVQGDTTQNSFGLGNGNFDVAFWIGVENSLIGKIQIDFPFIVPNSVGNFSFVVSIFRDSRKNS